MYNLFFEHTVYRDNQGAHRINAIQNLNNLISFYV